MAVALSENRALRLREAAEYCGCSERTLRRACHRRELPFVRRGRAGTIRIRLVDLDRWLRGYTHPAVRRTEEADR